MTATLKKIGGSIAVIIPKHMAKNFAAGEEVELTEQENGILLTRRSARKRRPISEIIKNLDPKAYARHSRELLSDAPVGKEIW